LSGREPHDLGPYLFFRCPDRLRTRTEFDRVECAIAFDLECVREIPALVDYILSVPGRKQRALEYVSKLPYLCRWAPNLVPGQYHEHPELDPLIPMVCILCDWFPAPWLSRDRKERHEIVRLLERSYQTTRPLHLMSYPLSSDALQQFSAVPGYQLFTVALSARESFAQSAKRLIQARRALGHKPLKGLRHPSRTDHGAVDALFRLVHYRLAKLPPEEQALIISELRLMGLKVPKNALSQAKRRMLAHFHNMRWSCLLQP
jgi:hypothetical protein